MGLGHSSSAELVECSLSSGVGGEDVSVDDVCAGGDTVGLGAAAATTLAGWSIARISCHKRACKSQFNGLSLVITSSVLDFCPSLKYAIPRLYKAQA